VRRILGRRGLTALSAGLLVMCVGLAGSPAGATVAGAPPTPRTAAGGYWLGAADGGVFAFGTPFLGAPASSGTGVCRAPTTADPWIYRALAPTRSGQGYWVISSETFEGGPNARVEGFGDARLPVAPPPLSGLNAQVVGGATTNDSGNGGGGLWLVGADGGVFSFGDAPFLGSLVGSRLAAPVVGMVADPSGPGYWLVASDGGVFAFGSARFQGSLVGSPSARQVVGMAATPDGRGYWLVTADGAVVPFGDAPELGSLATQPYLGQLALRAPIVGMAATSDGGGYWLTGADGGVFCFGDAPFYGSTGGLQLNASVVGVAAGA
jgi:hypothetical protein